MAWRLGLTGLQRGAVFLTVTFLVGCGGGGGGGGSDGGVVTPPTPPTSPTPPPPISIRASADTVVAGGAAVDLDAVLQNGTPPVLWGLDGPGSLSASSGASVRYLPPAADSQRVMGSVRIVASTRDGEQSLALALWPGPGVPAPEPGWRWDIVSFPKQAATELLWLNGRFIAALGHAAILDSTDGIVWTNRPAPAGAIHAITHGPAGYLAVGINTVIGNPDGRTWASTGASGSFHYDDVAADDRGYVAVGPSALARSVDGTVWQPVGPAVGRGLAVAHGAGRFVVAVNEPVLHTSTDGTSWTVVPLQDTEVNEAALAYGNGRFLLLTEQSRYTSVDGRSWVREGQAAYRPGRLRFANGNFYLSGWDRNRRAVALSSPDGVAWTELYGNFEISRIGGAAGVDGRTVVADGTGQIRYQLGNGVQRPALPGPSRRVTGLAAAAGALYGVTDWGQVIRSADARSWSTVAELPAGFRGLAHGAGRFVAVADQGPAALYTSTDGQRWSAVDSVGLSPRMLAVTFGSGVFVAVGERGESLRSLDGQSWQLYTGGPVLTDVTGVAHGVGRFVAVGFQGSVVASVDGTAWTEVRNNMGRLHGITHGPAGFVAVGGWFPGPGRIWTSPNGTDWTERSDAGTPALRAVTYGDGRYVAAGYGGVVLLSDDGVTWQRRDTGVRSDWHAVGVLGRRLVVAGDGGGIAMSEQ